MQTGFAGKIFLVLGMGRSGQTTASWLRNQGAEVLTFDDKQKDQTSSCLLEEDRIPWESLAAVVQSPGVPYSFPRSHRFTLLAKAKKIPILTDIDLLCQANPESQFIGITGTNGKSTTTALIGHILQTQGYSCAIGGNIGIPVLSLPSLGTNGIYVLELSSFQLEISSALPLTIAAWLNFSPDHLDRHGNLDNYLTAKRKIFLNCHQAVVVKDDPSSAELYQSLIQQGKKVTAISCHHRADIWVKEGILHDAHQKCSMDLRSIETLQGLHNYQNASVAYAVCKQMNLSVDAIEKGLRTFPGLSHRQEIVGRLGHITFVNDSKATNAEAVSHALVRYQGYRLYWIVGGIAKSQGIKPLQSFFPFIHQAFLIGQSQQEFAKTFDGKVPYMFSETLDRALDQAIQAARQDSSSDKVVILLSPACASYDQFESFEHRGDMFRQQVQTALESLR